jgi:hypothetical protein
MPLFKLFRIPHRAERAVEGLSLGEEMEAALRNLHRGFLRIKRRYIKS